MDVRNRDELLKKKDDLEAYLLDHSDSSLFGWYARQNMESGHLDRAISICKLGLAGGKNTALLHKLLGECFLAKGEITRAMRHFMTVIISGEAYPNVIVEVIRNLGDNMEAEQIAYLVRQLNLTLPGHPEATRFYKKYPTARSLRPDKHHLDFLKNLADSLDKPEPPPVPEPQAQEPVEPPPVIEARPDVVQPEVPMPPPADVSPEPVPAPAPKVMASQPPPADEPEPVQQPPAPQLEAKPLQVDEIDTEFPARAQPVALPRPPKPPKSNTSVKHTITRSMATFTLMQIFKDQGMYDNALEVLEILKEKTPNKERIDEEYKEIQDLIAAAEEKS